jgi:hypothetical protein
MGARPANITPYVITTYDDILPCSKYLFIYLYRLNQAGARHSP